MLPHLRMHPTPRSALLPPRLPRLRSRHRTGHARRRFHRHRNTARPGCLKDAAPRKHPSLPATQPRRVIPRPAIIHGQSAAASRRIPHQPRPGLLRIQHTSRPYSRPTATGQSLRYPRQAPAPDNSLPTSSTTPGQSLQRRQAHGRNLPTSPAPQLNPTHCPPSPSRRRQASELPPDAASSTTHPLGRVSLHLPHKTLASHQTPPQSGASDRQDQLGMALRVQAFSCRSFAPADAIHPASNRRASRSENGLHNPFS